MRYCRRTFFNILLQPHRVGKCIPTRHKASRVPRYSPKKTMAEFRRGKTPRNSILARHAKVKYFKVYKTLGIIRTSQSIFIRRAKSYVS